ncbi:thiamine biosynthesis protein [Ceratobasidium theobromae]|uniref:Thiamine biosynthesis protein n=1 Tax=Ceratobasidium theobromae TaxID=1582974 RepID=A0A5N5QU02_9AGAM|nr:thiamine biosynthesis protein [Ceratobasidium theobromae]
MPKRAPSPQHIPPRKRPSLPFRPTFKSECIQAKDSTFQARLFSLDSPAPVSSILAYMRRQYPDFQHHMAAWRYLVLKPGMTGLEGDHAFEPEKGCEDDGESRGGKTILDVLERTGLSDVLVVVSRRFGGTMLGPARFTHIADCARAVCTAMFEREQAAERASLVADLVAQLREWDTEIADLRLEIATLEPRPTPDKGKQPMLSLKPPDYTNVLDPPDVEKAQRLLQARQKTVQSLKALYDQIDMRAQQAPPSVLTIAGTDPSGGAGIQADLKTIAAHGCYGTSVITALVAQNTCGVRAVHVPAAEFITKQASRRRFPNPHNQQNIPQLKCVLEDIPPKAIKTGMLADEAIVDNIVNTLTSHYGSKKSRRSNRKIPPLIVDPVIISSSGHALLAPEAIDTVRRKLIPLATLVTPNLPEAETLLGRKVGSVDSLEGMVHTAGEIIALGPEAALVKGGHSNLIINDVLAYLASTNHTERIRIRVEWGPGCEPIRHHSILGRVGVGSRLGTGTQDVVVDVLRLKSPSAPITLFVRPKLETASTHGTGCTLSSALACAFAQGLNPIDATLQATAYAHEAIATAPKIGKGKGPLNHMHTLVPRTSLPKEKLTHFFFNLLAVGLVIAATGAAYAVFPWFARELWAMSRILFMAADPRYTVILCLLLPLYRVSWIRDASSNYSCSHPPPDSPTSKQTIYSPSSAQSLVKDDQIGMPGGQPIATLRVRGTSSTRLLHPRRGHSGCLERVVPIAIVLAGHAPNPFKMNMKIDPELQRRKCNRSRGEGAA